MLRAICRHADAVLLAELEVAKKFVLQFCVVFLRQISREISGVLAGVRAEDASSFERARGDFRTEPFFLEQGQVEQLAGGDVQQQVQFGRVLLPVVLLDEISEFLLLGLVQSGFQAADSGPVVAGQEVFQRLEHDLQPAKIATIRIV